MKPKTFIAYSLFAIVFAVSVPLRGNSNEPVLRVGHGVKAPRAVNHPDPEYSEEARRAGLQGTCVLSLVVNSKGKPENVIVSRSLGMGLDEKAVEAVRNWTFDPALKDGKPVAVQISVVVTFRMGNDATTPSARKALERAQKTSAEFRLTAWKRVHRIEGATTAPLCHSTQKEDAEPAPVPISALNTEVNQYRLASITFINNKALRNATALRSLFPIQDGETFDWSKVVDGLRSLRNAYQALGFVSVKSSVEPQIDNPQHSIALRIECNEGRQFYVDHINIEGLDEGTFRKLRKSLYVKPGDIYNERLAALWLDNNSRLIASDKSVRGRMTLDINGDVGTLVVNYDFTACAD